MGKKTQGIHDKGIATRIQQIWDEEGHHLLAVIPNVFYMDKSRIPLIQGEIDILKLYSTRKIGIEEVKSNINNKSVIRAQNQLKRARDVFKYYEPRVAAYFADCDTVIPYDK